MRHIDIRRSFSPFIIMRITLCAAPFFLRLFSPSIAIASSPAERPLSEPGGSNHFQHHEQPAKASLLLHQRRTSPALAAEVVEQHNRPRAAVHTRSLAVKRWEQLFQRNRSRALAPNDYAGTAAPQEAAWEGCRSLSACRSTDPRVGPPTAGAATVDLG